MKPNSIELDNLAKVYQMDGVKVEALLDVSLKVASGEFVSIMGPSGSGKSTLMHLIGCLDRPTSGSILIEGESTAQLGENQLAKLRREKVGFVFQTFNLLPRTNALKNVELPLVYMGIKRQERFSRAKEALSLVGLADRLYHRPSQLSGGQQQRVAIARALVHQPAIILADEPTGNLDSKAGDEVMTLLEHLHAQGKTIILVTHEEYVASHAQRIIRLLDGKVVSNQKVKKRISAREKALKEQS